MRANALPYAEIKKFTMLVVAVMCMAVSAGAKPKIAVYVPENARYSQDQMATLRTATLNTIVRSNRFEVIERSDVIASELQRQTSGAIDDDQLTAFGRQLGAQYICVSDMIHLRNRKERNTRRRCNDQGNCRDEIYHTDHRDHQVSARIIDVETAEVMALGVTEADIQSGQAMSQAVIETVNQMLRTMQTGTAPDLPRTAVYLQGNRANSIAGRALYTNALEALFVRSRSNADFRVVERSDAFTRQIDREQGTQRSGHIDDNQIARLGRQYGIQRILVANIDYTMNTYNISSRLVNIETASVEKASQLYHENSEFRELRTTTGKMVEDIVQWRKTGAELAAERKAEQQEKKETRNSFIWSILGIAALVALVWAAGFAGGSGE